jgi:hypothetical protein
MAKNGTAAEKSRMRAGGLEDIIPHGPDLASLYRTDRTFK